MVLTFDPTTNFGDFIEIRVIQKKNDQSRLQQGCLKSSSRAII